MYDFLKDLNEQQFQAATHTEGPLLLLAGAGSGKTKTIISRTLFIMKEKKINPENILVMTFTNKAAREMRERGQLLLGDGVMPEFTTFHSWGVRFLKSCSEDDLKYVGIKDKFTIIDTDEQKFILNKIKFKILDEKLAKTIKMEKFILTLGSIQNSRVDYSSVESSLSDLIKIEDKLDLSMMENVPLHKIAELFYLYKKELRNSNNVDFEDLINYPIDIIKNNEIIKNFIQSKYKFIMVDEFQDTNNSQLDLLFSILNETNNNICVVGDDSQSIYGWRGADIKHILNFKKYFDEDKCRSINLSINYRSSKKIVEKANKLLLNANERHKDKADLEAFSKDDGHIVSMHFKQPSLESDAVARRISLLMNDGEKSFAILYRSAIISRNIELSLIKFGVPYSIHNGKTLLERKVALNIISYLKFISNPESTISLAYLLVGTKTLTEDRVMIFLNEANESGETLLSFLKSGNYKELPRVGKNLVSKIDSFISEYEYYSNLKEDYSVFVEEFFRENIVKSPYDDMLLKIDQKDEKIAEANSNLNVISMVYELSKRYTNLDSFLEILSLEGEESDCETEKVNLMTVHASKGLEFENVFVVGSSEEIFPSKRSIQTNRLEEERRLFYVAITRAKRRLFISGSETYNMGSYNLKASRFIKEAHI